MINAERIAEMKHLSAEATRCAWFITEGNFVDSEVSEDADYYLVTAHFRQDAQFIAESRQFVPDIIAAYEEQADEIAKLRKALEFYADRESWAFHANEYDVHDDRGMTARDALK